MGQVITRVLKQLCSQELHLNNTRSMSVRARAEIGAFYPHSQARISRGNKVIFPTRFLIFLASGRINTGTIPLQYSLFLDTDGFCRDNNKRGKLPVFFSKFHPLPSARGTSLPDEIKLNEDTYFWSQDFLLDPFLLYSCSAVGVQAASVHSELT